MRATILAQVCLMLAAGTAFAGTRVALVVGNNAYADRPLRNCVNDARSIGATLAKLGFVVKTVLDADRDAMDGGLTWLENEVRHAELGVFYFSGHGMQVDGVNHLVPVGTDLGSQAQVRRRSIDADQVAQTLHESGCRTSVLILDACRDNPFVHRMRSAASRGLAPMAAFPGSYIAFAADAGQTADDNPQGANGLYTAELLGQLPVPGLTIEQVFKRTRAGVVERSRGRQVPAEYSRLIRDVSFVPGQSPADPVVRNTGVISITSIPMGAGVFLDGAYAGEKSPVDLERPAGRYRVTLRLAGYREWSAAVTLKVGAYEGVKAALEREASAWVPAGPGPPGREDLPPRVDPPGEPPGRTETGIRNPTPGAAGPTATEIFARAQEAFDAGRYVDPAGTSCVELVRQALSLDPARRTYKILETRAATSAERQAREATGRGQTREAARIYDRLALLFPSRGSYGQLAARLRRSPISGTWRIRYSLIISSTFSITFADDGTCYHNGGSYDEPPETGTWTCVDPARQLYRVTWPSVVETLTLSEDGRHLEGNTTNGRSADGEKIADP